MKYVSVRSMKKRFIFLRILLSRVAFFLAGMCFLFYVRPYYAHYIYPESMQSRVERSIPTWLNSTLHSLNELPALNTSALSSVPLPGQLAYARGRRPKHPVVIVPGFVSSGLELWEGLRCGKHFFRQRMWGTPAMARAYFTDRACWMQHMRLDPTTGIDPPGIKLRAVTGLEAVDWFVPGYFVWGKIIENLGAVGYDVNTLHAAPYDWRLSPHALQERDGYFTRLKASIETMVSLHGVPVAVLAHSYGDQLTRYFLRWVETPTNKGGGGGGNKWTDKHVAVYVNIAGPMLGIPKAVPSLLSGEMRDTALLGQLEGLLGLTAGSFVSGTFGSAAQTFRTWGSMWSMLPRGGSRIWGGTDADGSPDTIVRGDDDDGDAKVGALRHFLSVRTKKDADGAGADAGNETDEDASPPYNLTIASALRLLFERHGEDHPRNAKDYRRVLLGDRGRRGGGGVDPVTFGDPLVDALPNAKNLRILCLYGVGKPTERAYHYVHRPNNTDRPFALDVSVHGNGVDRGVILTDGDGSIPLVSLGYMCARGWRRDDALNPARIPITIREYEHKSGWGIQEGRYSGDHVNIMGNVEMIEDVLEAVTGHAGEIRERTTSRVRELSEEVHRRLRRRSRWGEGEL